MIYLCSVGGGADLAQMLTVGRAVILGIIFTAIGNVGLLWLCGRIFKWNWEEMVNASCASIGGPTTAVAVSINKGWKKLIVPGLLIGLLGYAIGNYLGLVIGNLF